MSLATVLVIAKDLAARPGGMSNADLAKAANFSAAAAGAYLQNYVQGGHIFKGAPEGRHPRYFDTAAKAEAFRQGNEKPMCSADTSHEAVAREAVAHLRKQTLGSVALAGLCKVSGALVDAALVPLVDAGKLTRISVLRNGGSEFDYRWSSTWVPCDADFALCRAPGQAPKAAVSPVAASAQAPSQPGPTAAPAAPAVVTTATPNARAPRPPSMKSEPGWNGGKWPGSGRDASRSGADGQAAGRELERAFQQPAQSLGWAPAPAPAESRKEAADRPIAVKTARKQPQQPAAPVPAQSKPEALQIDAEDVVCALNSRGELALDVGGNVLIKFKPRQALIVTRFLAGNTVLEQMHARGEL